MANYFIYATDDSGSTYGDPYFNTKGLETLKTFHDEVKVLQDGARDSQKADRIVYLHWSNKCVRVKEDEVISRYTNKNGSGCDTLPHKILNWMAENLTEHDAIKLLYVITDGAIQASSIKPCDPDMKIDNVIFYAFNKRVENIDMSVASMFICNNKRYIIHCNEEVVDETDLSTEFNYDQINIETFDQKIKELKSYIKLQFLTKKSSDQMALNEIKKLKLLRTRLFDEIQAAESAPKKIIDLNVKDKDLFIDEFKKTTFFKTLINPEHLNAKQNIESGINALINYINNDKKSFKFDNLKLSQTFTPATEKEEIFKVDYENVEEISFPDIIMSNETGVPVILLTHYNLIEKILFKSGTESTAHFSRFRSTIECPLILLHDDNFKTSIEYYYNFEAFKSMMEHGMKTGPRTRQEFTGAIVPLEEFDDYNDYVLSCTYFGKRRVPYNKGLLYYVLYKTCEKLQYIKPNVIEYLKGYVVKRIAKTECYLGLSGVSIDDPLIRVNLTTALWYCVELSSIVFKNDPKHFTKEKMRMYSHFAEYMKEILAWFNYSIDTSSVDLRVDIFKHLNRLKRISRPEEKAMFILEQIFQKKDGFLVSEIINPNNIYRLNYVTMDHRRLVDESAVSAEVDVHNFAHFMDYIEITDVPICNHTMRPYFVTEDKTSFYEQVLKKTQRVSINNGNLVLESVTQLKISKIVSLYKLFISYVEQYSKFPTLEDYKLFVLKKKQYYREKPVVFATNTLDAIERIYGRYEKIIKNTNNPIEVNKFLEITKQSVSRETRIRQENPIGFNMDDISNYIKMSERNVEFDSD